MTSAGISLCCISPHCEILQLFFPLHLILLLYLPFLRSLLAFSSALPWGCSMTSSPAVATSPPAMKPELCTGKACSSTTTVMKMSGLNEKESCWKGIQEYHACTKTHENTWRISLDIHSDTDCVYLSRMRSWLFIISISSVTEVSVSTRMQWKWYYDRISILLLLLLHQIILPRYM